MGRSFLKQTAEILRTKQRRKHLKRAMVSLSVIVAMLTSYLLILPAVTMERDPICGQVEHTHAGDCYEHRLICGKTEQDGQAETTQRVLSCAFATHVHGESCYNADGQLVCGYADYAIHTHDENCYDVNGNLVCTLPEVKQHGHDGSCYATETVLACGQEESSVRTIEESSDPFGDGTDTFSSGDNNVYVGDSEGGHTHTEECYETKYTLTCGKDEIIPHTHTDECYDENGNLVCGRVEIREHQHDEDCFMTVTTEAVEGHTHTDECYEDVLICDKPEHVHTEECYPQEEVEDEVAEGEVAEGDAEAADTEEAVVEEAAVEETGDEVTGEEATADEEAQEEVDAVEDAEAAEEVSEEEEDSDLVAMEPAVEYLCGKEEHTHGEECWDEEGNLICGMEEHVHDESCVQEADDEEAAEEPEVAYVLTAEGSDYTVEVTYTDETQIPDDAVLSVREIEQGTEEYESYYQQAVEAVQGGDTTTLSFARFFDISFVVDGTEIEPAAAVSVKISYKDAVEVPEGNEVKSVHFGEETEVLDVQTNGADGTVEEVAFDSSSFSVYGIVGTETLTGDVLTADGKTYTVTVTYGADAKIPEGATLQVEEVDQNSDEYINYSDQALKAITDDKDVEIASARFFDVSIIVNGKKYEPQAPVTIKITYNDPFNVEIGDEIKQVHFAENGTEVLDVDVNKDDNGQITDVIFDQGSFSVTGTVVTSLKNAWPSTTGYYAVIVKASNEKYYAIKNNGVLTEVKYDVTNNKVSFIDITDTEDLVNYQWTYNNNNNNNNKYLSNGDTYIDPQSNNGVSTDKRKLYRTNDGYIYSSSYGIKYYLSADGDKLTSKSGDKSQAVEVFFANQFSADGNAGGGTEGGEEEVDLGAPATDKTLSNNEDGTYNLSLSVTGKSQAQFSRTNVDVVIVFDRSGSMTMSKSSNDYINDYKSGRRDYEAIQAVQSLIDTLWMNNTSEFPDTVHISLVDFANSAEIQLDGSKEETQIKEEVKSIVNTLKGKYGEGTNWEAGLQKANSIGTRDGATKYVIFVSDGNPTFANNYGTGKEEATNMRECYDRAKDDARTIVKSGASFYTIGVFGNPDRMSNLTAFAYSGNDIGTYPAGHYQTANDQNSLNKAFQSIINDIQKNFTYTDVSINDGITDLTSTASLVGTAGGFRYMITDAEGKQVQVPDSIKTAYYDDVQGKVIWSLGDDYKLQNGYKYTVSFTVWPKQQAYDIISALENSLITFGDDNATVNGKKVDWSQFVINDDGTYSLLTNTGANVTYRQIKTTNGVEGEPSDLKETPITEAPSIKLVDTEITIKKVWNDSAYNNNRPDSIDLKVLCDNGEYKTVTLTGSKTASEWTTTFSIAPGLEVNGKILESGHDYTVVERDDYRYNFVSETIHPMLIGSATNITYGGDGDMYLTATNTLRGGINISKKVVSPDCADISSSDSEKDKEFTFTLSSLELPDGMTLADLDSSYTLDGEYVVCAQLIGADGNNVGSSYQIGQGDAFVLKPGQTLRLTNMPVGTKYSFTETKQEGYTLDSITEEKRTTPDPATPVTVSAAGGTVEGNTNYYYVFSNKRDAFNVNLVKVETGNTDTKLQGAEFVLYNEDGETFAKDSDDNYIGTPRTVEGKTIYFVTSDENGEISLGSLNDGTYILQEIKAPTGYNIMTENLLLTVAPTEVYITKNGQKIVGIVSDNGKTYTLMVENSAGVELPHTGGSGTLLYTLGGLMLTITALMYGFVSRRRRERRLR